MDVIVWLPERRDEFSRALTWATDGIDPQEQPRHDSSVIEEKAAEKVEEAAELVRDTVEQEVVFLLKSLLPVEIPAEYVARVATLLALEELEGWGDWNRSDYLGEIVISLLRDRIAEIERAIRYRI